MAKAVHWVQSGGELRARMAAWGSAGGQRRGRPVRASLLQQQRGGEAVFVQSGLMHPFFNFVSLEIMI